MKFKKIMVGLLTVFLILPCLGASSDYKVTNNGEIYGYDLIVKRPWVDVRAYGAKGDGVTDDTGAIQSAINSINAGIIFLPFGVYLISSELLIQNKNSIVLKGVGTDATFIKWNGLATGHMIRINGSYYSGIEEMTILSLTTKPSLSGICIDKDGNATKSTTELVFRKLNIGSEKSSSPYGMTYGLYVKGSTTCDSILYDSIRINGCDYAWYSKGAQSRNNLFLAPVIMYNGYGIYWTSGGYGPFTLIEPYFYRSDSSDIYLNGAGTDAINIIGGRSEGSNRLLWTSGTSFPLPVNIQGFSFNTNSLNPDRFVIQHLSSNGHLNLINSWFIGSNNPTIRVGGGYATIKGCIFSAAGDTIPITLAAPTQYTFEKCVYTTGVGGTFAKFTDSDKRLNTFTDQDATPSVANGNLFKTSNTIATVITMFDDGINGQNIKVIINDNNTTIDFTGTNLKGNAGVGWTPSKGDWMECFFDGGNWYCSVHDCKP